MPDLSTITPVTREEEFLDRIARAAASPNLPEVDTSDNGDVLTVVSGEWAAAAPPEALPEVTSSNNGQVLTVVSGEWAAANPSGGGESIILYATEDIPAPPDGYPQADPGNTYVSLESGGDALTYAELSAVYTSYLAGTKVFVYLTETSRYYEITSCVKAETESVLGIEFDAMAINNVPLVISNGYYSNSSPDNPVGPT